MTLSLSLSLSLSHVPYVKTILARSQVQKYRRAFSDVWSRRRHKIFFAGENPLSRFRGEEPRKHRSPLCATARGKRVATETWEQRVHRTWRTGSARRMTLALSTVIARVSYRFYDPRGHRRVAFCQKIIQTSSSFLRQMSNRTWCLYVNLAPLWNHLTGRVGRRRSF